MDWDDEDEKTTVFDRSDEDSAKALLHSLPRTAPAGVAAGAAAIPATVRGIAPPAVAPTPAVAVAPAAVSVASPEPNTSSAATPGYSTPYSAPQQSAPAYSAPPVPTPSVAAAAVPPGSQFAPPQAVPAPSGGSNKGLLIGGLLLAAAGVAAYLFLGTAKTGSLLVTVAGPGGKAVSGLSIQVNEEVKCSSSPCVVEDLPTGKSHIVHVTAPGYAETAGKAIKVVAGEETPLNIDLTFASAGTGIKVTSKTPGLRLLIDGKELGPLPQELTDLKPGSHTVEVSGNPFFAPFTKKVEVLPDQIVEIVPELTFIKGEITVSLGENAQGAKIWLKGDGDDKALHRIKLPETITIPADKKMTLVAEKKGFDKYERVIALSAEEPSKSYSIRLEKEGDRTAAPKTPTTSAPVTTPTTPTPAAPVTPEPAATTPPAAPSGTAKLNINSIPISNVILDGKPLGTTPKVGVSVSPGSHTVVFVHPQHGRKVKQVTVEAGQSATASVRFP